MRVYEIGTDGAGRVVTLSEIQEKKTLTAGHECMTGLSDECLMGLFDGPHFGGPHFAPASP